MRVAIMQPYFLPYIGYFQLISAVDRFIVYDNIKYTKKGWINRNRLLQNGKDVVFSLPLKSDSDSLNICERLLARDFKRDRLINQIRGSYEQAPYFAENFPWIEQLVRYYDNNLFRFIHHAIQQSCLHLAIDTEILVASTIDIDHGLKGQEKVLALCSAVGATTYVNAIGGLNLYSQDAFFANGLELKFLRSKSFEYKQSGYEFVPWLSILDPIFFCESGLLKNSIDFGYELISHSTENQ